MNIRVFGRHFFASRGQNDSGRMALTCDPSASWRPRHREAPRTGQNGWVRGQSPRTSVCLAAASGRVRHTCIEAAVALALLILGSAAGADLRLAPETGVARVGEVWQCRVDGPQPGPNPYDPAEAVLDAAVTAPSGRKYGIAGFYMQPHGPKTVTPPKQVCHHVRVFVSAKDLRKGHELELLLDDMRLVDRDTGDVVLFDDFEGKLRWSAQGTEVSLDASNPHSGKHALRFWLKRDKDRGWPGASVNVGDQDWDRFDEMRLWVCPLRGFQGVSPGIEFWTPDRQKVQGRIPLTMAKTGEWQEVVWRFRRMKETTRFEPEGDGYWALRFLPQEPGPHQVAAVYRDRSGERRGQMQFSPAPAPARGLARVSRHDPRYLQFSSGDPLFLIGMNLLGTELTHYRYFLDRLAQADCNFIRIWLSPRTLGFELKPGEYAQDRGAQLDALLEMCRERGIHVMGCLTDFREVCTFNGYWDQSPFNAAVGGSCREAQDFFTADAAKAQYRRKLRYAVARWASHPSLLAWEFFNEVNITNGWRQAPESVRSWHQEMGAHLRSIEPYGRLITSSFAGLPDDALWEQEHMQVTQRHFYLGPGQCFVDTAAQAQAALARHGKPALIGEFGRGKNRYGDADREGVSLHNGLWASAMSGGCGTAMTWWWHWVDDKGLWADYKRLASFLRGVDWPREGFQLVQADVSCEPDPDQGFGAVRIQPRSGSFRPAPFNQAVTVSVNAAGEPEQPELVVRHLHGVRNHPELHNPLTLRATYRQAGEFAILVAGVSQYGGAGLRIMVDGVERLSKEFPPIKDATQTQTRYNGRYAVPVPAGLHEVRVGNTGRDWLVVAAYEFRGLNLKPPVCALGLNGRNTVLLWLWNETHLWDSAILKLPRATLRSAAATVKGVRPGQWSARCFDPWTGEWGEPERATVDVRGTVRVQVDALARDMAWRLDRAP